MGLTDIQHKYLHQLSGGQTQRAYIAMVIAQVVVAMSQGRIVKAGSTEEIIEKSVLENLYDLNFSIRNINNNRICVYY